MSLFRIIPDNLFSVLSSPNRHLYVEALFTLRKAFKSEYTIERETLQSMLIDRVGQLEMQWQEENAEENGSLAGHADLGRLLMQKLEQTGWLELEYKQTSFEQLVTLPPYAVSILDVLWSLTEESEQEYGRHAFFTYTMLKSAEAIRLGPRRDDEAEEAWMAIDQAAREAGNLLDALKTLLNNIRRYHRMLSEYLSTQEILDGHFNQFQVLINERVYHPLKTRDAVQRYRVPVMSLCDQLLSDASFLDFLKENTAAAQELKEIEPAQQLIEWLQAVYDVFDRIESLLADIDQKNRAYTRASTDRLLYMIQREDNIRSYLIHLLSKARSLPEKMQDVLRESPQLSRQRSLGPDSLFLRGLRRLSDEGPPMAIRADDEAVNLEHQQGNFIDRFLKEATHRYSHQRVLDFIEALLRGKDELSSEDIELASDEDYILLILAIVKQHERNLPYKVRLADTTSRLSKGAYAIPRFTIHRKATAKSVAARKEDRHD